MQIRAPLIATLTIALAACAAGGNSASAGDGRNGEDGTPFNVEVIADFDEPWAMTFIPDSPYALITEKKGKLLLWENGGEVVDVSGVPEVDYGGQGGFGDIVLAPDFATSSMVYFSYIEAGSGDTHGAVVDRAIFNRSATGGPALEKVERIWTQHPKVTGRGHYSHRIAFSPDGKYLFIGSGERQKFDPAQDMNGNLGKVVRLNLDGSVPADNPFYTKDNPVRSQIWSLGHRNILGLAFDDKGRLWNQEMGPRHGDELNLVKPKANYGYPKVSNGNHYDGRDIPDHSEGDGFEAPKSSGTPRSLPAGLLSTMQTCSPNGRIPCSSARWAARLWCA